jgi:aspartate/methionine/tyrosine aminotransferase
VRAVYRSKRNVVLPAFEALGMRHAGGDASFFLWLNLPAGESSSEDFAKRLLDRGVLVAPGAYFGASGEGYVRVALVPTLDECRRAAQLLAGV